MPCFSSTATPADDPHRSQRVLETNLGADWRSHFDSFEMIPFAAASIGQVHSATLSSTSPLASEYPSSMRVAVKVQFPGVRDSITSDLSNLKWLLIAGAVLPRGLYLENTIRVMERELDEECDYLREAECGLKMRDLLAESHEFAAPRVVSQLCGPMVLTTEFMEGRPLSEAISYSQELKDEVSLPRRTLRPSPFADQFRSRSARRCSSFACPSFSTFSSCKRIRIGAISSTSGTRGGWVEGQCLGIRLT